MNISLTRPAEESARRRGRRERFVPLHGVDERAVSHRSALTQKCRLSRGCTTRHARDVVGVGEGGGMHVMFLLVTPKVRITRVVLLLGFRPHVGAIIGLKLV
jgi:hypothetical protein